MGSKSDLVFVHAMSVQEFVDKTMCMSGKQRTRCSVQQWLEVLLCIYLGLLCPLRILFPKYRLLAIVRRWGTRGRWEVKDPRWACPGWGVPESEKLSRSHGVILLGKPFSPAQHGSRRAGCGFPQDFRWTGRELRFLHTHQGLLFGEGGLCLCALGSLCILFKLGRLQKCHVAGGCCTVRTLRWAQKGRSNVS